LLDHSQCRPNKVAVSNPLASQEDIFMAQHSRSRTLALGLAGLGVAGSMAGLGTFATFTGTTSASHTIASGTVSIALGTAGSANNRLTIGATGLVPGDGVQRRVKLTNAAGNENLASVVLTTSASPSSLLDTDVTNGLQMKIEKCGGSTGWTESVSAPYTYTCDTVLAGDNLGVRSAVLATRAVVGSSMALSSLSSLTNGSTDDMVVTLTLPSSAGNTLQTLSSTITYSFLATQRAATDH
jgi:spore coat-associated protein N